MLAVLQEIIAFTPTSNFESKLTWSQYLASFIGPMWRQIALPRSVQVCDPSCTASKLAGQTEKTREYHLKEGRLTLSEFWLVVPELFLPPAAPPTAFHLSVASFVSRVHFMIGSL
jgi:hypothetical protein